MTRKHYDKTDMLCLHINQLEKRLEILEKIVYQQVNAQVQLAPNHIKEQQPVPVLHNHIKEQPMEQQIDPVNKEQHDPLLRRRFIV